MTQTKTQTNLWRMGILPVLALGSLAGLLGVYWDIAWHIDIGRDTFFTLPHNFIYSFMLIVLVISLYGLIGDKRVTPFHLPIGKTRLHPGMLIVAVGAALVLFFAPADDLWHRLFDIDITLWGPMHLVGLLGFTTATFGALITSWLEYYLHPSPRLLLTTLLFAAILLGWTMLYLAEFEYAIPAFPIFWHILLLTALPTFTLVFTAKLNAPAYAATLTALLFTLFRLVLMAWLMYTSSLNLAGNSRPAIPLLILSGLSADFLLRRNLPLWLCGLLIGMISFLSNLFLTFWQNFNWHSQALWIGLPLGLILSILMGYLATSVVHHLPAKPV
jgi:hypothetical protein